MRPVERALFVAAVVLGVASNAIAGTPPTAAELKKQGDDAMHALHYREALRAYEQAYALQHDAAILYNRARAEQGLGDYPAALEAIDEFVRVAPEGLKRKVPQLADLVADIRSHVGYLVVMCPVAGASVMVQGKVVGTTPLPAPIPVAVGSLAIAVEAPGYLPLHKEISAVGGKVTTLEASLTAERTETPPTPPPPVATLPAPSPRMETYVPSGWRVAAYATGGVGLASLAAGGIFGGLVAARTADASDHCPAKACDPVGWADVNDARSFATVSTVGFVAGGVLLAGAAGLFLFAPHAMRRVAIVPLIGPGYAGIGGVL